MGGPGSGRKPDPMNYFFSKAKEDAQAGSPSIQFQNPIASKNGEGIFIPNHSGITSSQQAVNQLDARFVNVTGDTMTGNLTISPASSYLRIKDNYIQDSSNKILVKGASGVNFQQYSSGWVDLGQWTIAGGLITNYDILANNVTGSTAVATDGSFYCQSFQGISQDIQFTDRDGYTHTMSFIGGILIAYSVS